MASTPGPSHSPHVSLQSSPYTAQNDGKRRAEGEMDPSRRRNTRPPLPPPHVLQSLVADSPAFIDLLKIEQQLDWTLLRKKAEINDALGRPIKVKRALRVFISNSAHDQTWQNEQTAGVDAEGNPLAATDTGHESGDVKMGESSATTTIQVKEEGNAQLPSGVDLASGKGVPGWILRVEGRLLDSGNVRIDKTKRRFTSFLKSVVVELENRETPTYPDGNIVEWHPSPNSQPLDGFEIMRRGDVNVKCRIVLHIAHYPERFRVMGPLSDLIAMKEGSRAEVMAAIWKVVKIAGAQDKEDGTLVRPIGGLEKILPPGADSAPFSQIPELATRFLAHPEPVIIPYTIRVDQDFNFHPKCFDIPIEIEDPQKSKMAQILSSFEGEEGREIVKLEDKVAEMAHYVRDLKQKREFLDSFAVNPQGFIHDWLAAQARDLDQMLGYQIGNIGTNGGGIREEDLRRSDLFNLPWVDEAVVVHEAARMEAERRALNAPSGMR